MPIVTEILYFGEYRSQSALVMPCAMKSQISLAETGRRAGAIPSGLSPVSGVGALLACAVNMTVSMVSAAVRRGSVPARSWPATAAASVRVVTVSYTHLRAHETRHDLVCRLLL